MTRWEKLRVGFYVMVTTVAVAGGGWVTYEAFKTMTHIEGDIKRLKTMQQSYSLIADNVPAAALQLNQSLIPLATTDSQVGWTRFAADKANLEKFLDWQTSVGPQVKLLVLKPVPMTAGVSSWLRDINQVLISYLANATRMSNTPPSQLELRLQHFEKAQADFAQLLAIVGKAQAEAQTVSLYLDVSKTWFPVWHRLLLVGIIVLTALCAWLIFEAIRLVAARVKLLRSDSTLNETRSMLTETQERLKQSASTLERQNKLAEKGRVAAELAHELHNPLLAINIHLYALQEALSKGTGEHQNASVIRKEIRRLNAILEDFQQLDRAPEPNLIPMSAGVALREVRDLLAPQLAQNAIELKVDSLEDAQFRADARLLEQVLINLVKNAAESIGDHGTVTLRARRGRAMLRRRQGDAVIIEIEDTGPGIPDKIKDCIYDAFFTTKKGGTGLGLSIAERIIERHGGTLHFTSEINHGTTFQIALPMDGQT